jgi:hypothetical protein
MLQLGPPSLEYSATRAPFHDGMHEEEAAFGLSCLCGQTIQRNALAAISAGKSWYRGLPPEAQWHIAELFGFNFRIEGPRELPYAYMPNGRQSYFSLVSCPSCGREYVSALDFYEKQPARYIGALQGVALAQTPLVGRQNADA